MSVSKSTGLEDVKERLHRYQQLHLKPCHKFYVHYGQMEKPRWDQLPCPNVTVPFPSRSRKLATPSKPPLKLQPSPCPSPLPSPIPQSPSSREQSLSKGPASPFSSFLDSPSPPTQQVKTPPPLPPSSTPASVASNQQQQEQQLPALTSLAAAHQQYQQQQQQQQQHQQQQQQPQTFLYYQVKTPPPHHQQQQPQHEYGLEQPDEQGHGLDGTGKSACVVCNM